MKVVPSRKETAFLLKLTAIRLILFPIIGFIGGQIGKYILFGFSVITRREGDFLVLYFTIGFGILGFIEAIRCYWVGKRYLTREIQNCVFVALGSNLGSSRQTILDAMAQLSSLSDAPILKSSLWQTTPVDCPPDSPMFVNAVVGLVPRRDETPESLLQKLREVEKEFGRRPKSILNEPRPLDLDLIAFGNEIRNSPDLILPHPRAHLRRFVLQPLSEIAPDLILPGQGRTVWQLLAGLPGDETITRL